MLIESVKIQNFRSFKNETIYFNKYTSIVGPNGSGKSNVLCALNIFFGETENYATDLTWLSEEDFHHRNTKEPIVITVTFTDLSESAQENFKDYVRQNKLIVIAKAEYDDSTGKAEVKLFGKRLGIEGFAPFFKAVDNKKKVSELKVIYNDLRKHFEELPAPGTKDVMIESLKNYEQSHPNSCKEIESGDLFYGISKGKDRFRKHIQWVHIPAVKDASTEQQETKNSALSKLIDRTVKTKTDFGDSIKELREKTIKEYQEILNGNQHVFDDISKTLENRLAEWSHPDTKLHLEWLKDSEKTVDVKNPIAHIIAGEGTFEGELCRFGHGLQRSYIFTLLQELADISVEEDTQPTLILCCEEPELYQHPPQSRHLASILKNLSEGNTQVILCTHSPNFVSGKDFSDIRITNKHNYETKITQAKHEDVGKIIADAQGQPLKPHEGMLAKIDQALQPYLSEMFFTKRLILVEGLEDIAYITSYLTLSDKLKEFRRRECHIVPTSGKSNMINSLAIAKSMQIPTFVLFDGDCDKLFDRNGKTNESAKNKHQKDNLALQKICGVATPEAFPDDILWSSGLTMWKTDIEKTVKLEIGEDNWKKYRSKASEDYGSIKEMKKISLHIGASLFYAWEEGKKSKSLLKLCQNMLEF